MEKVIREQLARIIHDAYRKEQADRLPVDDSSMVHWDALPEAIKESNRLQVDDIEEKMMQLGYVIVKTTGEQGSLRGFSDEENELMAEMEHDRWINERFNDDWKYGEKKDFQNKTSPYLVLWSELSDEAREWDRQTVRKIPEFLAKVGMEIRRSEEKIPSVSPHDVFISYSSEGNDKVIADAVCAKLENEKIRCWIAPRDIIPGKHWGGSIVDAISKSSVFVLVFSNNSNESPQVLREVERAVSKGLPILPFRIEDVNPSTDLEYYLSSTHWLDALTPPIEEHIHELAKTIRILMGSQGLRDENSYVKDSSNDSSQQPPGMAGQRTEDQQLTSQNPELSPDENVEENDLYDIDIDLMMWSERETKANKNKIIKLRKIAILLPVINIALSIYMGMGNCDGPCPADETIGELLIATILVLLQIGLNVIMVVIAVHLAKRSGFSPLLQIIFPIMCFIFCMIPLAVLALIKPMPREALEYYKRQEENYQSRFDITSQKQLALIFARRAFLYYQIDKQADASKCAVEALSISNKFKLKNLSEQLNGLLNKI